MALILSALFEHPVKSARGNSVQQATIAWDGLSRDRRFLIHTSDGTFVSGRSHPNLVLINAHWNGRVLQLTAPGMSDLEVTPSEGQGTSVSVWKDRFDAWDLGAEPARWVSEFLKDSLRMAWLGDSQRRLRWDWDRRVTFADAAPLLIVGSRSVADLSARVGEDLSVRRFRPNLVISGASAYEEDRWRRIRIGTVEFLQLDGCGRCDFTKVDPETAAIHPLGEPVATLETFRKVDTGIYFGMNAMPQNEGVVRVGDVVEILETRTPLFFGPVSARSLEAPVPDQWPVTLICEKVVDRCPGVKTYHWKTQEGSELRWTPGQYLTFRIVTDEGPVRRSYTISSATRLETTVKKDEGGRGSRWIHENIVVGSTIVAETLGGSFTWAQNPWPSYLLIGAGAGMTPFAALVEELGLAGAPTSDIRLLQVAKSPETELFREELNSVAKLVGDALVWRTHFTSMQGRLDHQSLVKFCPDVRDRVVLVCGPSGFRQSVRQLLSGAGVKIDRRYREEVFGEDALVPPEAPLPGIVVFRKSCKSIASDGTATVLQLAERAGVDLPSSCRSGDCGSCRVALGDGTWGLACETFPRGDLEVDA